MAPPPASIAEMTEQFTAATLSALPQAARLGVRQTTVAEVATLSGIGLHSGRQVNVFAACRCQYGHCFPSYGY